MKISVNDKNFKNKEDAMKYIEGLEELIRIKIFNKPDLSEGRHGPILVKTFEFKKPKNACSWIEESIKAQIENKIIETKRVKYDFVQGNKRLPMELWRVDVETDIGDTKGLEEIDIDNLDALLEDIEIIFL